MPTHDEYIINKDYYDTYYLKNKQRIIQNIHNYKQTDRGKAALKRYYQKHRKQIIAKAVAYKQTNRGRDSTSNYYRNNSEYIKKHVSEHRKTEQGKISHKRADAKRKRKLNFIPMFNNPFDNSELIEWHHINDVYVVAVPKVLHRLYYGNFHREKTMEIVKQIYLE